MARANSSPTLKAGELFACVKMKKITQKVLSVILMGNMISLMPNFASAENPMNNGVDLVSQLAMSESEASEQEREKMEQLRQELINSISDAINTGRFERETELASILRLASECLKDENINMSQRFYKLKRIWISFQVNLRSKIMNFYLAKKIFEDMRDYCEKMSKYLGLSKEDLESINRFEQVSFRKAGVSDEQLRKELRVGAWPIFPGIGRKVGLNNSGTWCFLNSLMQQINGLPQLKQKICDSQIVKSRQDLISQIERISDKLFQMEYYLFQYPEARIKLDYLQEKLNSYKNKLASREFLDLSDVNQFIKDLCDSEICLMDTESEKLTLAFAHFSTDLINSINSYNEKIKDDENMRRLSIYDLMQVMDSAKRDLDERDFCVFPEEYYAMMGIKHDEINGEDPIEIFDEYILPLFSENDVDSIMKICDEHISRGKKLSKNSDVTVITFPGLIDMNSDFDFDFEAEYENFVKNTSDSPEDQAKTLNGIVVATSKIGVHYCSFVKNEFGTWDLLNDNNVKALLSFDEVKQICRKAGLRPSMAFFKK